MEPEDNRQLPSRPWAPGSGQACRKKHSRISLIPDWRRKFARCYTKRIQLVCTKESRPVPPPPDPRPPHLAQPGAPQTKAAEPATASSSKDQNLRGWGRPKGPWLLLLGLCLGTVGLPSLSQAMSLLLYCWDLLEAVGDQLFPIFPGDRTGDSKLKLLGRTRVPTRLPTPGSLQGPFPRVARGRSPHSLARGPHILGGRGETCLLK